MNLHDKVILKTSYGVHEGFINNINEEKDSISYTGFLSKPHGKHEFEIVFIKIDKHFSGTVFWDVYRQKQIGHNASYIEDFEIISFDKETKTA